MMKINEMILVIDNQKGTERNALMKLEDFIRYAQVRQMDSKMVIAMTAAQLGQTAGNPDRWSEITVAENRTISARFCSDIGQLEAFLQGEFNDDPNHIFDEPESSWECLKTIKAYGFGTDGRMGYMDFCYEKLENHFKAGDILHNFNNRDYRVMEKYSESDLLLQDVDSGAMVVGIDTGIFRRMPKEGGYSEENAVVGIEWGHGVYLPGQLSMTDFRALRQEYAAPAEVKDIHDFRQLCNEKFTMYFKLSKDEVLPDSIKEAATSAMYEEFGTGRPDTFDSRLQDGYYDGSFIPTEQKERLR